MSLAVSRSLSHSLSLSQPLDEPVKEQVRKRSRSLCSLTSVTGSQKKVGQLLPQEQKMYDNFVEAVADHGLDCKQLPRLGLQAAKSPLYLACSARSEKGPVRPGMEDAHFDLELPEGRLIAIFDGHGEKGRIARQVSAIFRDCFLEELEKNPDDVRKVLIDLCAKAQSEITDTSGGTTALVTYFHNASNRIYTATLGDSELKIYRKVGEDIFSVPVSLVRDWKSKKDEARFLKVVDNPQMQQAWLALDNSKYRRFPPAFGINTARSLGDLRMRWKDETAVSIKPKVSMCQAVLDEGKVEDRLIFACDGLWDFSNEEQLIETVIRPHWDNPNLADHIVEYAIRTVKSQDNVTVMVGKLSKDPLPDTPPTPRLSRVATLVLEDLE